MVHEFFNGSFHLANDLLKVWLCAQGVSPKCEVKMTVIKQSYELFLKKRLFTLFCKSQQKHIIGLHASRPKSDLIHIYFLLKNNQCLIKQKGCENYKRIYTGKMHLFFNKFSQLNLQGNVQRSVWRTCMWILGFMGLIQSEIPRF